MTVISSDLLEKNRKDGTAPQGGPLPDSMLRKIEAIPALSSLGPERAHGVKPAIEYLGYAARTYPNDPRGVYNLSRVLGREVARATAFSEPAVRALAEEAFERVSRPLPDSLSTVAFSRNRK